MESQNEIQKILENQNRLSKEAIRRQLGNDSILRSFMNKIKDKKNCNENNIQILSELVKYIGQPLSYLYFEAIMIFLSNCQEKKLIVKPWDTIFYNLYEIYQQENFFDEFVNSNEIDYLFIMQSEVSPLLLTHNPSKDLYISKFDRILLNQSLFIQKNQEFMENIDKLNLSAQQSFQEKLNAIGEEIYKIKNEFKSLPDKCDVELEIIEIVNQKDLKDFKTYLKESNIRIPTQLQQQPSTELSNIRLDNMQKKGREIFTAQENQLELITDYFIQGEKLNIEKSKYLEYQEHGWPIINRVSQEICTEICAFMNTDGGILILGINDEKIVKGIMLNNKDRDLMGVQLSKLYSQFIPQIQGQQVKPYFYPVQKSEGQKEWSAATWILIIHVDPKRSNLNRDEQYVFTDSNHSHEVQSFERIQNESISLDSREIIGRIKDRINNPKQFAQINQGQFQIELIQPNSTGVEAIEEISNFNKSIVGGQHPDKQNFLPIPNPNPNQNQNPIPNPNPIPNNFIPYPKRNIYEYRNPNDDQNPNPNPNHNSVINQIIKSDLQNWQEMYFYSQNQNLQWHCIRANSDFQKEEFYDFQSKIQRIIKEEKGLNEPRRIQIVYNSLHIFSEDQGQLTTLLFNVSKQKKENCYDYMVSRRLTYPPQDYLYILIIINSNNDRNNDFISFLINKYPNGIFKKFEYYVLAAFNKPQLYDIFKKDLDTEIEFNKFAQPGKQMTTTSTNNQVNIKFEDKQIQNFKEWENNIKLAQAQFNIIYHPPKKDDTIVYQFYNCFDMMHFCDFAFKELKQSFQFFLSFQEQSK